MIISKEKIKNDKQPVFKPFSSQVEQERAGYEEAVQMSGPFPFLDNTTSSTLSAEQFANFILGPVGTPNLEEFVQQLEPIRIRLTAKKYNNVPLLSHQQYLLTNLNKILDGLLKQEPPQEFKDAVRAADEIDRYMRTRHIRTRNSRSR